MIQGFPFQSSVFPGDTLTLCVSTDAPQFRVDVFRQGASLAQVLSSNWFTSAPIEYPDHEADQDWSQDQTGENGFTPGWPQFTLAIPPDFTSGVYIAMLVEGDGNGNARGNTPPLDTTTPDARYGKALFVVRSRAPGTRAQILYKLPLFTYHAYNDVGGWALYSQNPEPQENEPIFVSLRRPGGGTGGHPIDDWNYDPNDSTSARQVFAHWDARFIAWLERNGYAIDYATDLDLHTDPNLLAPYTLVLSVGHDEYWSKEMRDEAEAFIQNGGNFAFFSGNTCYWGVEFNGDFLFQRPFKWSEAGRPENSLTGVSYRNAGEGNQDRPQVGYVVQNHDHWVFAGTGLQEGSWFGIVEGLVGYEADGANFDRNQGPPFVPKGDDGTPATFVILGVGDTSAFADRQGNSAATMGVYTNGGTVFTGATTDWPRVVAFNGEPNTWQITRNVLDALSAVVFGTWQITANGSQGQLTIQWAHASSVPDGGLQVQGTVAFADQPGTTDTITGTWDAVAKAIIFVRGPDNPVSQTFTGFLGDNHPAQHLILAGWFTESDILTTAPRTKFGWFAEKSR